jgi:predicted transcriptional regulator
MGRPSKFTPALRAAIIANPHESGAAFAAQLGIPVATLRHYRCQMIADGLIPSKRPRIILEDVRELIDNGYDVPRIAKRLGVSEYGVRNLVHKHGLWMDDLRRERVYNATQVAQILGRTEAAGSVIVRCLKAHGLTVKQARKHAPYRVTADALMTFLTRPDCPVQPSAIADPDWRAFAEEARGA